MLNVLKLDGCIGLLAIFGAARGAVRDLERVGYSGTN